MHTTIARDGLCVMAIFVSLDSYVRRRFWPQRAWTGLLVAVAALLCIGWYVYYAYAATWNDEQWVNQVTILIPNGAIDEDLTDFPVYVDLADLPEVFWQGVTDTCGDIRVTDRFGTELPREVVWCDRTSQTGELHFKANAISSDMEDSAFFIYWNGVSADYAVDDTYGAQNVWTNGFAGVWHMQEDPGGTAPQILDSTSNGNEGTSGGDMANENLVSGQVGLANQFDGDDDIISIPHDAALAGFSAMTFSAWLKSDSTVAPAVGGRIISKWNGGTADDFAMILSGGSSPHVNCRVTTSVQNNQNTGALPTPTGWYFVSCVYDGSNLVVYRDGTSVNSVAVTGSVQNSTEPLTFGDMSTGVGDRAFPGIIDSIRISSVARSAAWIAAEYLNQSDTSSFYQVIPSIPLSALPLRTIATTTAPAANDWTKVVAGSDRLVAVAQSGANRVMVSTDNGATWTGHSASQANEWRGLAYGGGTFVATALNGTNRVMTSTNGTSWTNRTASQANSWIDVTYGDGLFVAVSYDGTNRVMTSTDGTSWNNRTAPLATWITVTHGGGRFVALANDTSADGHNLMYSDDGITWTGGFAVEANQWERVRYGNGRFVAVAKTGMHRIIYSDDGINWSPAQVSYTETRTDFFTNVLFVNGQFVIVQDQLVLTSPDGIVWTVSHLDLPAGQAWYSSAAIGSNVVHIPYGDTTILRYEVATSTLTQSAFRFRDDDGSETTASFIESANSSITWGVNTPLRARFQVTSDGPTRSAGYALQYRAAGAAQWHTVGVDDPFPQIVGTSSGRTTSDTTTHTVTIPTGEPDDLLLVIFSYDGVNSSFTSSPGWERYIEHVYNSSTIVFNLTNALYWKFATGTTDALTITTNDSTQGSYIVYRIRGGGQPFFEPDPADNPSPSSPLLQTGAVRDYVWISTISFEDTYVPTAPPSGFGGFIRQAGTSGGAGTFAAHRYERTDALNPGNFGGSPSTDWIALTIAVPPRETPTVQTARMQQRGGATGTNNTSIGSIAWTTPNNIGAADDTFAALTVSGTTVSNYLFAQDFGFAIPENAVITGIRVGTERTRTSAPSGGGEIVDDSVRLVKGGVVAGDNLAYGEIFRWPQTEQITVAYGSSTALWGTSWTPADINDPGFGFAIAVRGAAAGASRTAQIDHVEIEVYYTIPSAIMLAPSTNIARGGVATTTARLSAPSGFTTSDFSPGYIMDDRNPTNWLTLADGQYTELEWSIVATGTAATGDSYELRVAQGYDGILDEYSATATLDIAVLGEVSGVVNVQSGSVAMNGVTVVDVTIDSVDLDSTFVHFTLNGTFGPDLTEVMAEFVDATTLRFTRVSDTNNITIQWFVVEDTAQTVQRGVVEVGSSDATVTVGIEEVNLAKSFILMSNRTNESSQDNHNRALYTAVFSAADELRFDRSATGATSTIAWQVVTIPDAFVQSGIESVGGSVDNITLSPVATSSTFVVTHTAANSSGLAYHRVQASLTSTTNLELRRIGVDTTVATTSWFVIEVPRYRVQQVESDYLTTTTVDVTIDAVDRARTWTIGSSRNSGTGGTQANRRYTLSFPNDTTWRRQKQTSSQNTNVVGYIIELEPFVGRLWSSEAWTQRAELVIDHTVIDEDLVDFPVYVDLANLPAEFWAGVRSDGGDIRVMNSDLTAEMPREVVWINVASSSGELHFRANAISSSTDTTFYIYWNGVTPGYDRTDLYGSERVWTNGFVAVYHDGGGVDSTVNRLDGTGFGGVEAGGALGQVGRGTEFDGSSQYFDLGNPALLNFVATPFTICAWHDIGITSTFNPIVSRGDIQYVLKVDSNDRVEWKVGGVSDYVVSSVLDTERFHYSCGTTDGDNYDLYVDGVFAAGDSTGSFAASSTSPVWIARNPQHPTRYFPGVLDGIRISSVERSAAWLAAEFINQSTTTDFYRFTVASGPLETTISGVVYSDQGVTPLTGMPQTVKIAIGTASTSLYSTTTNPATGAWSVAIDVDEEISDWEQLPIPDVRWRGVAYGNGRFVAVADGGPYRFMYSDDGINWATTTTPADANAWRAVAYGNGRFVAVACGVGIDASVSGNCNTDVVGTRVMYSFDGITWATTTALGDGDRWRGITYGDGQFVAVAQVGTNRIMTSPDGITWTARPHPENNQWFGVAYGNGRYVAVAETGTNRVMYSDDGAITWTATTTPSEQVWRGVAYGNGRFVAVGGGSTAERIMYSFDGMHWFSVNPSIPAGWSNVRFLNGRFVATSQLGYRIATSIDGVTWESTPTPEDELQWRDVAFGHGRYVMLGSTGTSSLLVADAGFGPDTPVTVWVDNSTSTMSTTLLMGAANGASGVPLYHDTVITMNPVASTTSQTRLDDFHFYDQSDNDSILYRKGIMTAFTTDAPLRIAAGTTVLASETRVAGNVTQAGSIVGDGRTIVLIGHQPTISGTLTGSDALGHLTNEAIHARSWATVPSTPTTGFRRLAYDGTTIVSISVTGNQANRSTDQGLTWATSSTPDGNWQDITYGNGTFVAVGIGSAALRVITSTDGGQTWEGQTAPFRDWRSVTYGGGQFVAVSSNGDVMTSPDGETWTSQTAAAANDWRSVTYGDGRFVAVAWSGSNRVMYSDDGEVWSASPGVGAATNWMSVTYGKGRFVAVSAGGWYMTSPDGINWVGASTIGGSNRQVAYGNGYFVTVGNTLGWSYTSPDGLVWTRQTLPLDQTWEGLVFTGDRFVAVSSTGATTRVIYTNLGTLTFADNAVVRSLTNQTGRTLSAPSELTLTGNFTNNGTFTANGGLVTLAGTSPQVATGTMTGTSAFAKLTITNTSAGVTGSTSPAVRFGAPVTTNDTFTLVASTSVSFQANATSTFEQIDWVGVPGVIYLRSSEPGTQWRLSVPGDRIDVLGINVQDSLNIGLIMTCGNCTDNGNNTNWSFADFDTVTLGGVLYLDYGETPAGAGATIKIAVGTSTPSVVETTTASDGTWERVVSVSEGIANSTSYTVWLSGSTTRATTYVRGIAPLTTATGVDLHANTVTVINGGAVASVNMAGMTFFDRTDDAEVGYTATTATTTIHAELYIPVGTTVVIPAQLVLEGGLRNEGVLSTVSGVITAAGTQSTLQGTLTGSSSISSLVIDPAAEVTEWATATPSVVEGWVGATYANGRFVVTCRRTACTLANNVMTSDDGGITWTSRSINQANSWSDVVYGDGTFVAVALDGTNRIATSPDGTAWTLRSAASAQQWRRIIYGNGTFVVVASNSTADGIMTSTTQGASWIRRTAPTGPWWSVAYSPDHDRFVVLGNSTTALYSDNGGVSWSTTTIPARLYRSVTYGNGRFVALGGATGDTNRVVISDDGITWTVVDTDDMEGTEWRDLKYDNGVFVAVGWTGSNRLAYSRDGIQWTRVSVPADEWQGLALGGGAFVAVANGGTNRVLRGPFAPGAVELASPLTVNDITIVGSPQTDAVSLYPTGNVPTALDDSGWRVAWNGDYLAVADISAQGITWYRLDGDSLTKLTNPDSVSGTPGVSVGNRVAWNGDYLAVGHTGSPHISIYRKDEETLTKLSLSVTVPGSVVGAAWDDDYLALAHDGAPFLTLYKFVDEDLVRLPDPQPLSGAGRSASWNGRYLVVGYTTSPYISLYRRDGNTLTYLMSPSGASSTVRDFAWSGDYLAVAQNGSPGLLFYRLVGDALVPLATPAALPGNGRGVAWSGDYLAVAHTGSPFLSLYQRVGDQLQKLSNPPALAGNGQSVAWNGRYLAIAHEGSPFLSLYERDWAGNLSTLQDITVTGNWTQHGTTELLSGTTTFAGTSAQTVQGGGAPRFYKLTVTNTSTNGSTTPAVTFSVPVSTRDTFTMVPDSSAAFAAGETFDFRAVNWRGTDDAPVYLRSTTAASTWSLATTTEISVGYVNVRDSVYQGVDEFPCGITCTDNGNNTNWRFTGNPEPWSEAAWPNRVAITIDHTKVDATLFDFPVYINLADLPGQFWSGIRSDGGDIRVTTSAGVEVPREVVWVATSTQTGELHFRADSISSTTDTTFYVYWNGVTPDYERTDTYGSENVWTNGYLLVHHLNAASGDEFDSTRARYDLTQNGTLNAVSAGQLGTARGKTTSSDSNFFEKDYEPNLSGMSQLTLQAWIRPTGGSATIRGLWSKRTSTAQGDTAYAAFLFTDNTLGFDVAGTRNYSTQSFSLDTWYNIHHVFNGSLSGSERSRLYIDGVLDASGSTAGTQVTTITAPLNIFRLQENSNAWIGDVDEFRLSNLARSAAWIRAEHINQASPTDFYRVSSARVVGSAHSAGSLGNAFSFMNKTDEPVYSFTLTPQDEAIVITDLVITGNGLSGITTDKLTNFRLYIDANEDNQLDGGDTQVGGSGIFTINNGLGAITFSDDFTLSTTTSFLMVADITGVQRNDTVTFRLLPTGLTGIGTTSGLTARLTGLPPHVQHSRFTQGGGGSGARLGGAPVAGDGVVEGGGASGGGAVGGPPPDGQNITPDDTFFAPTLTGDTHNEWTNPENAFASDGTYATAATPGLRQTYRGFGFSIPTGNEITGLALKIDASGSTATGSIDVALSWDGGSSFTTMKATPQLSGSDIVYLLGGNGDTWGRSWTPSEFTDSLFRVRVTANPDSNVVQLDAIEVRVFHQTPTPPAGGGGGGGRV